MRRALKKTFTPAEYLAMESMQDTINVGFDRPKVEPLAATVGFYQRHILVCTGKAEWPSKIEEDGGFAQALAQAIAERGREFNCAVKITACDEPSNGGGCDLLVFPDAVRYIGVEECDLGALVEDQLVGNRVSDGLQHESLVGQHHIFICCHRNRDLRCGVCGPPLAELFEAEVARRDLGDRVHVHRTSHLGGHQYAGNVIVYPEGDWFGYMVPEDVPRLVEQFVIRGRLLPDRWRGRMGLTKEEQQREAARLNT